MYFVTYLQNSTESIGVLLGGSRSVVPLGHIFKAMDQYCPNSMNDFISICDQSLMDRMTELLAENFLQKIPIDEIQLLSPIPYPKRNIFCLGKNYLDHVQEIKGFTGGPSFHPPEHPIYFSKIANPAVGDLAKVLAHKDITQSLDYEVELAVIIGKQGKNISREDYEDYIFGYTIANDFSARDLQKNHTQWLKGKSLDTFCSLGPAIVHKNVIHNPSHLNIGSKVNGELRQNSNTKNMIFDIPYIISDLSNGMTLMPGDIILTGTPSGVGLGFDPPKYLHSGDEVTCYIEQIGFLKNTIE